MIEKCPKCGYEWEDSDPTLTIDCKLIKINAVGKRAIYTAVVIVLILTIGFISYSKYKIRMRSSMSPYNKELINVKQVDGSTK